MAETQRASLARGFADYRMVLGVHLHTWRSGTKRGGWKSYIKVFVQLLLLLAFTGGVGWAAFAFFRLIDAAMAQVPMVAHTFYLNCLMGLGLTTMMLMVMSTLNVVYQYIYESEDLAFLLATPLSPRAVFGARFTESYFTCLLSAVPFGIAPAVALGLARGAGPAYYVIVAIGFAALVAMVLAICSLLLLVVMRYVPGQKLKQATMVMGLLVGLMIVLATQYAAYRSDSFGKAHVSGLSQRVAAMHLGDLSFLPHAWLAHAALHAMGDDTSRLAVTLLPLVVAGLLAMTVLVWVAADAYVTGWSGAQQVDTRRAHKGKRARRAGLLPSTPFWGLVTKEYQLMVREPMLWYNYLVGIVVVVFFILNSSKPGADTMPPDFKRYFLLFMVLFGATVGGTQMAGSALSREGGSWEVFRALPGRPSTIYLAKLAASSGPSLLLSIIGVAVLAIIRPGGIQPLPAYQSLGLAVVFVLVLTSLMLTLDMLTPNFKYRLTGGARGRGNTAAGVKSTITSLGNMAYLVVLAATLSFPLWGGHLGWFGGWSSTGLKLLGYGVFGVETIGVCAMGFLLSTRKLSRLLCGDN